MNFLLPQQRDGSFPGQVGNFRDRQPSSKQAFSIGAKDLSRKYQEVVRAALRESRHELEFRKGVMSWLLEVCADPTVRRELLAGAVQIYRKQPESPRKYVHQDTPVGSLAKAYGGKYHAKVPKEDGSTKYVYKNSKNKESLPDASEGLKALTERLRLKLRDLIVRGGEDGFDATALTPLIKKYGANEVTAVLREFGNVTTTAGRVFVTKYTVHASKKDAAAATGDALAKASPEQLAGRPSKVTGVPGGRAAVSNQLGDAAGATPATEPTGRTGPEAMPVGSKRIWNNRVLEKKPDGKWHVIGRIAGLEGEAVPSKRTKVARQGGVSMEIRGLTDKQMQFLIDAVKQAKKQEKKAASKKAEKDEK